jgi:hypothetical protein
MDVQNRILFAENSFMLAFKIGIKKSGDLEPVLEGFLSLGQDLRLEATSPTNFGRLGGCR